jgi:hypothetical protein
MRRILDRTGTKLVRHAAMARRFPTLFRVALRLPSRLVAWMQ